MQRAAIISIILEQPRLHQRALNDAVSEYTDMIRGRMGIPFGGEVALISLTVVSSLDRINAFTGRVGKLPGVTVKASIAKEGIAIE